MVKNNKANRMHPANSKYTSTEFAAENTAADTEFGQEAAGTAGAVGAAGVTGAQKGIVQKVQEADQK
ncbi:hypothetical protein M5X00_20165 [Paenibacillus alvei]|uniref:hypothetical protein n=1 Tax=Paenibacillus alvei TaxID=44250 RepID=UPI0002884D5F|nr:hypothetical protein [Paenibacillus alvei]EJW16486.1 hypothetical protein PAV_5c00650 [Paenibacillus alvei DSM 29]MCY9542424.1 hypothetical protein [Paenibacillus alvei]MCY9704276.1 hypothetical protein [Paenibacillus alvei]MCY9733456.1 hypothetical protein [Paenibacillus alvei]MCY9756559.1 hypothetical protein [Paenibacillus alvei]